MDEPSEFRFPAAIRGISPSGDGRDYSTAHSDGFPKSCLADLDELWKSFRFVRPPDQQLLGRCFALWTCKRTPGFLLGRFTPETDQYGRHAESLVVAFIQPDQVIPKSQLASFLTEKSWPDIDRDAILQSGINLTFRRLPEVESRFQVESLLDTDAARVRILRSTHPYYEACTQFDLIIGPSGRASPSPTIVPTVAAPKPTAPKNEVTPRTYRTPMIAMGLLLLLCAAVLVFWEYRRNQQIEDLKAEVKGIGAALSSTRQQLEAKEASLSQIETESKREIAALRDELQVLSEERDRLRSGKSTGELLAVDLESLLANLDGLARDLEKQKSVVDGLAQSVERLREQIGKAQSSHLPEPRFPIFGRSKPEDN